MPFTVRHITYRRFNFGEPWRHPSSWNSHGGINREVRERRNWNDGACSYRRRLVNPPKPVEDDNDATAPPPRKVEGIMKTESINFNADSNRAAHHTADYEVPNLVVRRGQAFEISVGFNRGFNANSDEVKFIFQIGDTPLVSKGTEVHVPVGKTLDNSKWSAKMVGEDGNQVSFKLVVPANAIIGEWKFIVQTVLDGKGADKAHRYRFKAKETVYILFNPWCKEDLVFMPDEAEREEYVMNQVGLIWRGSAGANGPLQWNYAQFDDVCLDGALLLLKRSGLALSSMGNPVLVCRTLSQMANSNDNDGGVLSGNWSGNYIGGTSPSTWQGSGSIMEQYMRTKSDVKWAQCWVFSGLLTTLCRAVGLPTRSVTNFESAHDTDSSMTIDTHYNPEGKPMEGGMDDSVWNFHVWNESYFARPDLPDGYDGWQAHDSTPQEVSESLMRCGPSPLAAIKEGDVNVGYDTKFVYGEVNGDRVAWIVEPDGNMFAVQTETDSVGKEMSTKAVGKFARNDVTHNYKYPEGSDGERAANARALKYSSRREYIDIDESKNDCSIKLEVSAESNADLTALVTINNNNRNETRNVSLKVAAVAAYYTGLTGEDLKKVSRNMTIDPQSADQYELKIPASEWINTVDADATVKVFATAIVEETKQMMSRQKAAAVDKPELGVTANPATVKAGQEFAVNVSFTNPLQIPVTLGVFTLEGPGQKRSVDVEVEEQSIAPGQTVTGTAKFTPRFPGKKEVVAGFNSRQLTGITGHCSVNVTK